MLQRLADAGPVGGKTVGIDATTLEANAALRSIVRRDTGAGYETFLRGLAEASNIPAPTRAELARFDRKRPKNRSNDEWTHPRGPDAKMTRMKDGRTHLAHKAEHAVDPEMGAVVGVTVQDADAGDTKTMVETLITAAEQVEAVLPAGAGPAEIVGDKGYHSNATLVALAALGIRSYVSEPARGRRGGIRQQTSDSGVRGRRLLRQRGERLERPDAHLYETRRLRPVHLRGMPTRSSARCCRSGGLNLGLLMRRLTGVGTPRGLQGRSQALLGALIRALSRHWRLVALPWAARVFGPPDSSWIASATRRRHQLVPLTVQGSGSATGS